MLDPSFKRSPTAPLLLARSEPAKSTSETLLTFSPVSCMQEEKNNTIISMDQQTGHKLLFSYHTLDYFSHVSMYLMKDSLLQHTSHSFVGSQ